MEAVKKEKYDEMFITEILLSESQKQLNEYYIKLFTIGITIKDLNVLRNLEGKIRFQLDSLLNKIGPIKQQMKNLESFLSCYNEDSAFEYEAMRYDELSDKKNNMESIIKELDNIDETIINIIHKIEPLVYTPFFDKEVVSYILENTSLTHLIYTNNTYHKIKHYSSDSHMFLCPFHKEEKPSYGVTSYKNKSYCFGCGFGGNQITYIMNYENLGFIEAVYILAEIYMIEMNNNPYKNNNLIKKYREVLLSDKYMEFLISSIERLHKRSSYDDVSKEALKWYEKHLNSIKRIESNTLDESIKNTNKKDKVYKLEMPNFDN